MQGLQGVVPYVLDTQHAPHNPQALSTPGHLIPQTQTQTQHRQTVRHPQRIGTPGHHHPPASCLPSVPWWGMGDMMVTDYRHLCPHNRQQSKNASCPLNKMLFHCWISLSTYWTPVSWLTVHIDIHIFNCQVHALTGLAGCMCCI